MSPSLALAIEYALDEAERFGHEYIGTEHLLLALIRLRQNSGYNLLRQKTNLRKLRRLTCRLIGKGTVTSRHGELPLAPRALEAIESARAIAQTSGNQIDADHLFLGLIRDRDSVACELLLTIGVTNEQLNECCHDTCAE